MTLISTIPNPNTSTSTAFFQAVSGRVAVIADPRNSSKKLYDIRAKSGEFSITADTPASTGLTYGKARTEALLGGSWISGAQNVGVNIVEGTDYWIAYGLEVPGDSDPLGGVGGSSSDSTNFMQTNDGQDTTKHGSGLKARFAVGDAGVLNMTVGSGAPYSLPKASFQEDHRYVFLVHYHYSRDPAVGYVEVEVGDTGSWVPTSAGRVYGQTIPNSSTATDKTYLKFGLYFENPHNGTAVSRHVLHTGFRIGTARADVSGFLTELLGGATTTPTAVASAASSITTSAATMNGTVNPNGLATTYTFTYGTSASLASGTTTTSSVSAGSGTSAGAVTAALTGLAAGTTYYYRVAATNSAGTSLSSIVSFTTTAAAVAGATATIAKPTASAGDIIGFVISNGSPAAAITNLSSLTGMTDVLGGGGAGVSAGSTLKMWVFAKPYDPVTDTGNWTVTFDTAGGYSAEAFKFSGGDSLAPDLGIEQVTFVSQSASTSHAVGPLTSSTAQQLFVTLAAADTDATVQTWGAAPGSMTKRFDNRDTSDGIDLAMYTEPIAAAGTAVTRTLTHGASVAAGLVSFFIRPVPTSVGAMVTQAALDAAILAAKSMPARVSKTAGFTVDSTMVGKMIVMTNASAAVITLPATAGVGAVDSPPILIRHAGTGSVTYAASGSTLKYAGTGLVQTPATDLTLSIHATDVWWLDGALTA